jgi:hypothetical protein
MPGDGHARTQVFVSSYNARRADYHFLCASHAALFGVRSTAAALRPFSKLVGIYYCGLPTSILKDYSTSLANHLLEVASNSKDPHGRKSNLTNGKPEEGKKQTHLS